MQSLRNLCLFLCLFFNAAATKAQAPLNKKISIHLKEVTLSEALRRISQASSTSLTNGLALPENEGKITYEGDNKTLGNVLTSILKKYGLQYKVYNNSVIIVNNARPGTIVVTGKVIDSRTGSPLVGVTIRVTGTSEAVSTDVQGKFLIRLADENATLSISYIGYTPLQIKVGLIRNLTIRMTETSKALNEVVVQARRRANSEVAVLKERQNASVVSDAISAQQIEKTASITTAQALQRVSGVTITDDKYVAIRGLGDRSVVAELNGIRLSSANPDRSSVPLDLVPAALLDNVTVYKTLTPDRAADASAGIVELKTKSIPDSLTVTFVAQSGFNQTVGLSGKYNAFLGADQGYFGQRIHDRDLSPSFLGLQNQYPGQTGLVKIQKVFFEGRYTPALTAEANRINRIMHSFSPVLTTSYQQAVPNQIYTATFGDSYRLTHRLGGPELGIILSGNYYRRTEDRYNGELNQYFPYSGVVTGGSIFNTLYIPINTTPDNVTFGKYLGYRESSGIETINYGVLGGLSIRINQRNEISAQYLGSRGSEVQGNNLTGTYQNTRLNYPIYNQVNILSQSYRVFNTLNFQGEHKLVGQSFSPRISYNIGISKSSTDQPDNRVTEIADAHSLTNLDASGASFGTDAYTFVTGQAHYRSFVYLIDPNGRFYRKLKEDNNNFKVDVSEPFSLFGWKQEIKMGGAYLNRFRRYSENILGIPGTPIGGGDTTLLTKANGDLNQLVSFRNIGYHDETYDQQVGAPRIGGYLYQIAKTPNNYTGFYATKAVYAMLDSRIGNQFRIIGGVRFESTFIKAIVDTSHVLYPPVPYNGVKPILISNPVSGYSTKLTPYYSVNLVYTFRKNMNFRFAYNTSLARPELREITQAFQYDPFQFAVIGGNTSLRNQLTRSGDFRWEWFPHPSEVFSVSAFYKKIYHQLTKTFQYTSQGTYSVAPEIPIIIFQNDPETGKVYGLEFEARKNLQSLTSYLNHFTVGANLLIAASEIRKNPTRLDASHTIDRRLPATSPVFEQAPYSVNVYLDYDNPKTGSTATISFNEVGERLVQVQLDGTPDLYDRPVPLLDFVFSQKLGRRFQIKGFAKNILNHAYQTVYTIPGNQGTYRGNTFINHRYFRGSEYSLGITFNLF